MHILKLVKQTLIAHQRNYSKLINSSAKINKMFDNVLRVRLDEKEKKAALSLKCKIVDEYEREINLNRDFDEDLLSTFQKLYASFMKHYNAKTQKTIKKLRKDDSTCDNDDKNFNIDSKLSGAALDLPLSLHDLDNRPVPLNIKNRDAWKENYTLRLRDQTFSVCVNLPSMKKISLPKLIIAGFRTHAKIDVDSDHLDEAIIKNSIFAWYASSLAFNQEELDAAGRSAKKNKNTSLPNFATIEWSLIQKGSGLKSCLIDESFANKFVKVICQPCDGLRKGLAVESVSNSVVQPALDKECMAMTHCHKLTQNRLCSDKLRVMTYNILANCYSESVLAREQLYTYCPPEILEFKYRRVLLVHEIKNYNADLIFLQECEPDFIEEDLASCLPDYTYLYKTKGETREGEAILFRNDRFKVIKSHDISISNELKKNPLYERVWQNLCKNEELQKLIGERNTILQVAQLESLENPGERFLLANTHLFFHPKADFIRLLQAVVSIKYLEKLKHELENSAEDIKKLRVIFAGDFNSDPPSKAFKYIFTQSIPWADVNEEDKEFIRDCDDDLTHSLSFSTYCDFPFTNCIGEFEGILDYIFFESNSFELDKVIPQAPVDKVKEFVALPNKYMPSDHLPLVFELKMK